MRSKQAADIHRSILDGRLRIARLARELALQKSQQLRAHGHCLALIAGVFLVGLAGVQFERRAPNGFMPIMAAWLTSGTLVLVGVTTSTALIGIRPPAGKPPPPPHKRRAHVQLAYGAVHLDAHRSIASAIQKRQDLTLRSQIRSVYRLEMAVRNLRAVNARRARALCLTERFLVSAVVLSTLALVIGQLASLIRIGPGTNPLLQSSSSTTPQVRPPATLKGFSHSEPASPAPRSPNDGAWHRFQRATSSDHRWE